MPTVFSLQGDPERQYREVRAYDTNVLRGYSSMEQRVQLRALPRCELNFGIVCATARESQLAASLIFTGQDEVLAVPIWQYASPLAANVTIGDTTIFATGLTDVPYRVGGYAIIWQDAFTFELVTITAAGGISIGINPNAA